MRIVTSVTLVVFMACDSTGQSPTEQTNPMAGTAESIPPTGGSAMGGMNSEMSCMPEQVFIRPHQLQLINVKRAACQVTSTRMVGTDVEEVAVLTYNPAGYLTLEEYADRTGGRVTRRVSRSVDGQGRPLRIEEDRDGDSVPDTRIVYTYANSTPAMITALHDEDADGMAEFSETQTLDSDGRLTRLERRDGSTSLLVYVEDYTYDDDGREILLVRRNRDMEIMREEAKNYDEKGRLTSVEVREGKARILTQSTRSTYVESPCQKTTVSDVDGDNNEDGQAVELFDDLNRIVERRFQGDDGAAEALTKYTYDGDQLIEVTVDVMGDGTVEQSEMYSYNPQGRLAQYTRQENKPGGGTTTTWTYSYIGCD